MSRVICAGHINWDVTLRVDRLPEPDGEATVREHTGAGGGSAANVAATLAGFDVPVGLLGSVGSDRHGAAVREELADAGVDCSHVVEVGGATTAVKYLVVDADGEVMVLGFEGANEAFDACDLDPAALEAATHLHLTSQRPGTAAALAERAVDAGVTVSFDPGRRVADRAYAGVFARADVVFLNDREAAVALDGVGPDPGSETGTGTESRTGPGGARLLVIKHGEGGAEVRGPDRTHVHPGFDVDVVDTTGAGDAFAAGFLAARLDGADVERALAVANAAGALAAGATGARARLDWSTVTGMAADGSDDARSPGPDRPAGEEDG